MDGGATDQLGQPVGSLHCMSSLLCRLTAVQASNKPPPPTPPPATLQDCQAERLARLAAAQQAAQAEEEERERWTLQCSCIEKWRLSTLQCNCIDRRCCPACHALLLRPPCLPAACTAKQQPEQQCTGRHCTSQPCNAHTLSLFLALPCTVQSSKAGFHSAAAAAHTALHDTCIAGTTSGA